MKRALLLSLMLAACTATKDDTAADDTAADDSAADDTGESLNDCDPVEAEAWTEESHAKGVEPNYDLVFDDSRVLRMDIVICPSDYDVMQADIEDLMGSGGGGPGGGGSDEDPVYVPAHLSFDGGTWPYVGVRYKGNSSLNRAWRADSRKLPFRIDFDRFEDSVPATDNQRFWGFKELKFNSAFDDVSLIRDKLAADTFRDAGVPAARAAFVEVHVDYGEGPVFWGLYTVFEEPCDELPEDWFGDGSGDCYKADGDSADLGSYEAESFENKSNDDGDWADVQQLVSVLGSANPGDASWRSELEAVLNVDGYLRYQALNALIANWDTYGQMTHNYYLYSDPSDGRLNWVPWDYNEGWRRSGTRDPSSIDLGEISAQWPLIRHTQDDPVYRAAYLGHLEDLMGTVFTEASLRARAEAYQALVAPFAEAEAEPYTNLSSLSGFEASLDSSNDGIMTVVAAGRAEAQALLE